MLWTIKFKYSRLAVPFPSDVCADDDKPVMVEFEQIEKILIFGQTWNGHSKQATNNNDRKWNKKWSFTSNWQDFIACVSVLLRSVSKNRRSLPKLLYELENRKKMTKATTTKTHYIFGCIERILCCSIEMVSSHNLLNIYEVLNYCLNFA